VFSKPGTGQTYGYIALYFTFIVLLSYQALEARLRILPNKFRVLAAYGGKLATAANITGLSLEVPLIEY
jgi:hypothetical protein